MASPINLSSYKGSTSLTLNEAISTPVTLQDISQPVSVFTAAGNEGSQIGGQGNVNGSNSGTINVLDAGAVAGGLALGEKSVAAVVDTTAKVLDAIRLANIDALNFAEKAGNSAMEYVNTSTNQNANAEKQTNYTLWVAGAVVVAWAWFRYGRGGR